MKTIFGNPFIAHDVLTAMQHRAAKRRAKWLRHSERRQRLRRFSAWLKHEIQTWLIVLGLFISAAFIFACIFSLIDLGIQLWRFLNP